MNPIGNNLRFDHLLDSLVRRLGMGPLLVFGMIIGRGLLIFSHITSLPNGMISNFGSWVDGKWVWIFTWRRQFFTWELELFNSFLDELKLAALQTNRSDS
ncbi:hypothetical protein Lal_00024502 [Lupinus albus]|nr:hypothetical protein Lal_00024502 [Lupinus albus]